MTQQTKPHLLHASLDPFGYLMSWRIECPFATDDPLRPCIPHGEDGIPTGDPVCVLTDWVDECGGELLAKDTEIDDPQFPMPVVLGWEPGGSPILHPQVAP